MLDHIVAFAVLFFFNFKKDFGKREKELSMISLKFDLYVKAVLHDSEFWFSKLFYGLLSR